MFILLLGKTIVHKLQLVQTYSLDIICEP